MKPKEIRRNTVKKKFIPKINSIHFGGKWLILAFFIGGIAPLFLWLVFHIFLWQLCVIGGMILVGFIVIFAIEMHQDFGKVPYYERHLKDTIPFNPQKQYAVIRCSICTGEQVAGFKNIKDGHFTEVMVIKTKKDERRFKQIYDIETVNKEY